MGIHTVLRHDPEFGIPKRWENAVHYLAVAATQLEFFISVFRGLAPTAICCRHSVPYDPTMPPTTDRTPHGFR